MSIQSKMVTAMLLAIFGGFAVVPVQAQDYDLVILNGRVMDPETNYDAVANVGIKDGIIAVITEERSPAKRPSMPRATWSHPGLSTSMPTGRISATTACRPCRA